MATSTDALTRSPTWKPTVVAFFRDPAPTSGWTWSDRSADTGEHAAVSQAAIFHSTS